MATVPTAKYHVKYYYLATGMEGRADERDYGIVEAVSPQHAKELIADRENISSDAAWRWFVGCLTAEMVE